MIDEKEAITLFEENKDDPVFQKNLGILLGSMSSVKYNARSGRNEYDIIALNARTSTGVFVPVLDIEIENSFNNGVVNRKYNNDYLLSFIFNAYNNNYSSKMNGKVYSTMLYSNGSFVKDSVNIYADYLVGKVRTKNNMSQLESILNSRIKPGFKNALLFFFNDLFTSKNRVNNHHLRHLFYEPGASCVRGIFGKEHNSEGVVFLLNSAETFQNVKRRRVKQAVERYLNSKYAYGVAKSISSSEIVVLTKRLARGLVKVCRNSEVSRIIKISGTKEEVLSGSSVKKIIQL